VQYLPEKYVTILKDNFGFSFLKPNQSISFGEYVNLLKSDAYLFESIEYGIFGEYYFTPNDYPPLSYSGPYSDINIEGA